MQRAALPAIPKSAPRAFASNITRRPASKASLAGLPDDENWKEF
jgi:hypothetical protein